MWPLLKKTIADFLSDDCPLLAAALAYYTLFSLAPLLLIVLAICGFFLDAKDIQGQLSYEISTIAGKNAANQIQDMISEIDHSGQGLWATTLGSAALLFGASGIMVQLQAALNKVWKVTPNPNASGVKTFLVKRLISLAMLMGIAFLLLVSMCLSWLLKSIGQVVLQWVPGTDSTWIWIAGHEIILWVVASALFAIVFRFMPDAKIRWADVRVGAVLTATLFVAGKFGISMYLSQSNLANVFGAAGSLVLILVWVYYSAMILLLGAEFTHSWAQSEGHDAAPEEGATRVE